MKKSSEREGRREGREEMKEGKDIYQSCSTTNVDALILENWHKSLSCSLLADATYLKI